MKSFKENLNIAVLTSKNVVNRSMDIVFIAHHDDGMWEFWGNEQIDERDIMVVTLAQIIEIDASVNEVADLPIASTAYRRNISDTWKIHSKN